MQMRVSHFPQVPCKPFQWSVKDVFEGVKIMNVLAEYDLFQYKNNIKGDYANATVLEVFDPEDKHDSPKGSWVAWYDEASGEDDPCKFVEEAEAKQHASSSNRQ